MTDHTRDRASMLIIELRETVDAIARFAISAPAQNPAFMARHLRQIAGALGDIANDLSAAVAAERAARVRTPSPGSADDVAGLLRVLRAAGAMTVAECDRLAGGEVTS